MVSHADKWIRIYDIPETSQHKKGFTIYKVISMLYPEKCPDAITKITVWKRYNEFKKLHRELKSKHRSLRLADKFPTLPSHPFFKRFNSNVIMERRTAILFFLEYIAKQPELFTSDIFVKFFESSHTPNNLLSGSINSIRADLHLPCEPEYLSYSSISSDDEHTLSDTDSVSTLSSLNASSQVVDLLADPLRKSTTSLTKLCKKISSDSLAPVSEDTSIDSTLSILPTPPETPSLSNVDFSNEYIVDAAHYITQATEMELAKEYDTAFSAYKKGIDILLHNVRYDADFDRREKVRQKVERYLLRAEKIYNLYLSPEIRQINEITKSVSQSTEQKPLAELYKYKAIKIIESGMLVLHAETQELFFVKVIHKTCKYSSDYLILPDNVPYMIKLHNYYDCENAVFLILQYCCGTKLSDYIQKMQSANGNSFNFVEQCLDSDNESEGSYSDLINEYAASKLQITEKNKVEANNIILDKHVTKIDDLDAIHPVENDYAHSEIDGMLSKSHKLLSTIDEALSKTPTPSQLPLAIDALEAAKLKEAFQRKLSDKSVYDDLEFKPLNVNIEDVTKWAAQLLLALEKLHIIGVVCGDLNMNNLLIDENKDLVLTYMCSVSEEKMCKTNGEFNLAPELFSFGKINSAADWWSYGTILYELLVGVSLKTVHPEGITSYSTLKVPKYVSPEGRSLLKQLLVYEPSERLGCGARGTEDIKTHPFFNTVCWDNLVNKYVT
ncbi:ribosomal protein s6 kinase [Holotrichia oblita]|uniref:Ribosomal protein s6 kinase n=1 Tax=Holotrichia oblita TaxID=644536 RepID=A0ACB9TPI0_HOLOL|nr:ribosomal protein s6 kinase [Holotrichia oblita]